MHNFCLLSLLSALVSFFSVTLVASDLEARFVSPKHKEIAGYDVYASIDRMFLEGRLISDQTHSMYPQAYMKGVRLRGNFFRTKFNGADLRNADLRDADFTAVDFSYADLSGAHFNEGTILHNANFYGAKLDKIILEGEVDFSDIRDEPHLSQIGLKDKIEKSTDSFGRKMGGKMRGSWKQLRTHKRTPSGSESLSSNEISPLKKSPSGKIVIADSPRPALNRVPSKLVGVYEEVVKAESMANKNPK